MCSCIGTITIAAPVGLGERYVISGSGFTDTISTNTKTGLIAGNYTINVLSVGGCASMDTTITVNVQPEIPAKPVIITMQPTCSVVTGTISISTPIGSGLSYSIDGSLYQNSPVFSGVVAGNYQVSVINQAGCISIDSTLINILQPIILTAPSTIIGAQTVLAGSTQTYSVQPVAGAKNYTWSLPSGWSGTSTTSSITVTAGSVGGTISVVANADSCISAAATLMIQLQTTTMDTLLKSTSVNTPINICSPELKDKGAGTAITTCDGTGTSPHGSIVVKYNPNCITYTPALNYAGKDTVCIIICNNGVCDTTKLMMDVLPVVPLSITTAVDDNDSTISGKVISGNVLQNDTNTMGAKLTASLVSGPANNQGELILNTDGSYTFTPSAIFSGLITIKYAACGGTPLSCDTAWLYIKIKADIVDTLFKSTPSNTPITICSPELKDKGLGTNIATCDGTGTSLHGSIVVTNNPTCITYTPDLNYVGKDSACIIICNNGVCDTTKLMIDVLPVVPFPITTALDDADSTISGKSLSGNVLQNDTNNIGAKLVAALISGPASDQGTLVLNVDGTYTFTSAIGYSGLVAIKYAACGGKPLSCDSAMLYIKVKPVLVDTLYKSTSANTPITICSPELKDKGLGTTISTCDGAGTTPHGSIVVRNDPTCITYTPALNYVGKDTACIIICNNGVCDTTRLVVVVLPMVPLSITTALDDTDSTISGKSLSGNVLQNDINSVDAKLTASLVSGPNPAQGALILNTDGSYTYTPAAGYSGLVTIRYAACGGTPLSCDSAVLYIIVKPVITNAPNVKLLKTTESISTNVDGTFSVKFKIKVTNPFSASIDSVRIKDDLSKVFINASDYEVVSVLSSGKLMANMGYNGSNDIDLVTSSSSLAGGATDSIYLTLNVKQSAAGQQLSNVATMQGLSPLGIIDINSDDPNVNATDSSSQDRTLFVIPVVEVTIPEGFSPNNDGIEDYFEITLPAGSTDKVELIVFNQWGAKVYSSNDYKNDWNGKGVSTFRGEYMPSGTYYYIVNLKKVSGQIKQFAGPLTIAR